MKTPFRHDLLGDRSLDVHDRVDNTERGLMEARADLKGTQSVMHVHGMEIEYLKARERQDYRPVVIMLRVVAGVLACILCTLLYLSYLGHILVSR